MLISNIATSKRLFEAVCQSATFSSLLESRSCNAAFFLSVSLLESKGEDDLILAEGPPPYSGQTGTRVKRPKATRTSVQKIFAKITVGEKYCVVALFKYFPHKFQ